MIWPPPGKSGALRVERTSWFSSFISAIAVSHTSDRLNEQMELAMPTAMPTLLLTRIDGKDTGSRVGSFIEES